MTNIENFLRNNAPLLAVLVDPDKADHNLLQNLITIAQKKHIDLFLVGGSLVSNDINPTVKKLKQANIPVILFPGHITQFSPNADAILFLSLISGRNPEYLIGQQVQIAFKVKNSGINVIPTGYILLDGGRPTSVSYISQTCPLPSDKTDLIVATALAGHLLGMRAIYLETGSGANKTVPCSAIKAVKKQINTLLFVGGGISSKHDFKNILNCGADIIVIGSAAEKNWKKILIFSRLIKDFKKHQK